MRLWDRFKRQKKSTSDTLEPTELALHGTSLPSSRFNSFREKATGFIIRVKEKLPKNFEDLKKLQTDEAMERMRRLVSGKAYGTYLRAGAALFAAYFLADTVSLFTDSFVPEPPAVPAPRVTKRDEKRASIEDYNSILSRNIFNSKGIIPEEEGNLANGPARRTNLPLNLVGTVVLADELKSIAAIEDKSQNMVFPLRVDDSIADKIRVTKIEHLRVYFVNKGTGHLEFVEISEDQPMFGAAQNVKPLPAKKATGTGISQADETHYDIERGTVDKAISNLSEVLQQARAIPNFENGVPDGYKMLQIVPGSIYDQLGIKNGDVVTSLNGDPINDPGKAFQLFNELKTTTHIEVGVKRGGVKSVLNLNIRQ